MSWVNPDDHRVLFRCAHLWAVLVSSSPDCVFWNHDASLSLTSTAGSWTMWWTRMNQYYSSLYWSLRWLHVVINPFIAQNNYSKLSRSLLDYRHIQGRKTVKTITSNKTNINAKISEKWQILIIHINEFAYFCCYCCS